MASKHNQDFFKKNFLKRWKLKSKKHTDEKAEDMISSDNVSKIKKHATFSTLEVVTIVIITAFVSLLMGLVISNSTNKSSEYKAVTPAMQEFLDEYNDVIGNYYGSVDESKLLKTALESVINSLGDAYTGVVDTSLSNSLTTRLQGAYSGFGIEIANDSDNNIYIISVLSDSPAEKVGLKANDKIVAMDGESVENMTTTDFVTKVKKNTNKEVTLTVIRDNQSIDFKITRDVVTIKSVSSTTYTVNNKKVGYIYVSVFAANTDKQFAEALTALEKENIDSLIIDLRDNTGGHLSAVENMMSEFFDKTHIIYQVKDKTGTQKVYSTGTVTKKYPIAVLVNKNSASASEMLTAALKEEYGATVVGITTYGKGTVQEVQTTTSGIQYKITTKKWLTPKGNWINGVGITPDIKVELNDSYFTNPTAENDNQLQAALTALTK